MLIREMNPFQRPKNSESFVDENTDPNTIEVNPYFSPTDAKKLSSDQKIDIVVELLIQILEMLTDQGTFEPVSDEENERLLKQRDERLRNERTQSNQRNEGCRPHKRIG